MNEIELNVLIDKLNSKIESLKSERELLLELIADLNNQVLELEDALHSIEEGVKGEW